MKAHNGSSLLESMKKWDEAATDEPLITIRVIENAILFLRKQFPEDDEIKENIEDLEKAKLMLERPKMTCVNESSVYSEENSEISSSLGS